MAGETVAIGSHWDHSPGSSTVSVILSKLVNLSKFQFLISKMKIMLPTYFSQGSWKSWRYNKL